MVEMEGERAKVKMSGYLFKKTRKRMMTTWKNYWFVLEERLLLYYRSKDEYEAISPCKGSINLGPPCAVKSLPSVANAFQIATRTTNYTLKAQNPEEQKKWLQTLLSILNQNQNFPSEPTNKLNHFRYSLDELYPQMEAPNPNKSKVHEELIERLQKLGAHSYGGSLQAISKKLSVKSPASSKEKLQASVGSLPETLMQEECILRPRRMGNNIYERMSGDSDDFRTTLIVDNENYSVPQRKASSLMVENDQYCGIGRRYQSDEVIYAEPKIDENKNMETGYYEGVRPKENIYEELDKFSDCGVVLKSEGEEGKKKLKKSRSFVKKMWKRKSKKKEVEVEAEKVGMSDSQAVQMLSELHGILETQMTRIKSQHSPPPTQDQPPEAGEPESPLN